MNATPLLAHPELVSPRWLAEHSSAPWLRVLDVRCRGSIRDDRSGTRLRSHAAAAAHAAHTRRGHFVEIGPRAGFYRAGQWPKSTDADFTEGHIPGSTHFDVAHRLFDASGAIVSAPELAMAMSEAGIGDEHTIVLVDDRRPSAALPLVWALRHYGHAETFLLDGGFERWVSESHPVSYEVVRHSFASFTARMPA